jgi:hypothetical protein
MEKKRRNKENKGYYTEVWRAIVNNMSQEGKKIIFGRVGMEYGFPKIKWFPCLKFRKKCFQKICLKV